MHVLGQFTPHDWPEFDWRPTASLKRWLAMLLITYFLFLVELGTFYLKFILWIPPLYFLCVIRLFFFLLADGVAMREVFEYLDNREYQRNENKKINRAEADVEQETSQQEGPADKKAERISSTNTQ
ncbi:unnamed protein product [Rotaria sp. Silwood2]|nr:unnamed protein product [Rotaria sp. Silwood2]